MGKGIITNLLNATIIYPLLSALLKQDFIKERSAVEQEISGNYKLVIIEVIYLIVITILSTQLKVSSKQHIAYFFVQWAFLFVYALSYSFIYYPINKGPSNIDTVTAIATVAASAVLLALSIYNFRYYKKKELKR